jgi:L-fuculokinase
MPADSILIFDVGKTNKKILIFDTAYHVTHEESCNLEESTDEDGFPSEDVTQLTKWLIDSFKRFHSDSRYNIKAVNFSAYGASFVYLNSENNVILPLYNYLKPYPQKLRDEFYAKYGGEEALSLQTASPVLGALNSGMQLYRICKEKPESFQKIKYALHLPQYLSFVLSTKAVTEITSVGCHTNLWDFNRMTYHKWVEEEGLLNKFPSIVRSDACVTNEPNLCIGPGLHDSSAALLPYLFMFDEPFVLISTGTWCISLNPFNDSPLTKDQLNNDCLSFLAFDGEPVKASRLFLGNIHDKYVRILSEHYHTAPEYFSTLHYDDALANKWLDNLEHDMTSTRQLRLDLELSPGEAYHHLMVQLVRLQAKSTSFVLDDERQIFVDGGFSRNQVFMNLLCRSFPKQKIYGASAPHASALGAALALHNSWNIDKIPDALISLIPFGSS